MSLDKNWVKFRQLGRVKTKTGSVSTIESSLDKSWVQFRRLHARRFLLLLACYRNSDILNNGSLPSKVN